MLLNEIINEVGMTKRAVKYYEESRLLHREKCRKSSKIKDITIYSFLT